MQFCWTRMLTKRKMWQMIRNYVHNLNKSSNRNPHICSHRSIRSLTTYESINELVGRNNINNREILAPSTNTAMKNELRKFKNILSNRTLTFRIKHFLCIFFFFFIRVCVTELRCFSGGILATRWMLVRGESVVYSVYIYEHACVSLAEKKTFCIE